MSQFIAGAPITLELSVYVDGTLTDLDSTPTVETINGSGGTVTTGSVSSAGTGIYQVPISALSDPNVLTTTWTGALSGETFTTVQFDEVVGGFLFTEADFRAFNDDQFTSTTRYTDAAIDTARTAVTEQIERWTGVSWVDRYARVELSGSGDNVLSLDAGWCRTSTGNTLNRPGRLQNINQVLSATAGSTSIATSSITIHGTHLIKTSSWTPGSTNDPLNTVVEYTYGQPYPVDGVDRIAMLLAGDRLRETVVSNRATTWSDELGTYRFETPGRAGNVSTIPEVNEWVKAHRSPLLSV